MKINKEVKVINSISLNEYFLEGNMPKKVIFVVHGFTSNKERMDYESRELAKKGYFVVAVDCFNHGDRLSNEYDALERDEKYSYILDIVIRTASDIRFLFNNYYYNKTDSKKFDAYGYSMGAATLYYLSTITNRIDNVVALSGSPSFYKYILEKQEVIKWNRDISSYLENYKTRDPLLNYKNIKANQIYALNGTSDEAINYEYAKELNEKSYRVKLELFDAPHTPTKEMINKAINFFD